VFSQGKTIPKAFPGYGVAFAETSGFEAATQIENLKFEI
jgi:hypothetical protein